MQIFLELYSIEFANPGNILSPLVNGFAIWRFQLQNTNTIPIWYGSLVFFHNANKKFMLTAKPFHHMEHFKQNPNIEVSVSCP